MRRALQVSFVLLVGSLIAASIAPLFDSDYWLVRTADFPRLQILILLGIGVILVPLLVRRHQVLLASLIFLSSVAALSHAMVLWPSRQGHGTLPGQCDEALRLGVQVFPGAVGGVGNLGSEGFRELWHCRYFAGSGLKQGAT